MSNPKKYLVDLDLCQNKALNFAIESLAVAPSTPVIGETYFDTVLDELRIWNGTEWLTATGGGARGIDGSNAITPPQVTADIHDYNPAGFDQNTSIICLDLDNNHDITGLQYKQDWQTVIISNDSNKDLTFKGENNNSIATNRFTLDANVNLKSGQAIEAFYNANKSRWFLIGAVL